jgi:hypothetical protein
MCAGVGARTTIDCADGVAAAAAQDGVRVDAPVSTVYRFSLPSLVPHGMLCVIRRSCRGKCVQIALRASKIGPNYPI